jgi:hypothetical protein
MIPWGKKEISKTKHPKSVSYKFIRTGALLGVTSKTLGNQANQNLNLNNTPPLYGCLAQGKAVFVIANAKEGQSMRIQT